MTHACTAEVNSMTKACAAIENSMPHSCTAVVNSMTQACAAVANNQPQCSQLAGSRRYEVQLRHHYCLHKQFNYCKIYFLVVDNMIISGTHFGFIS